VKRLAALLALVATPALAEMSRPVEIAATNLRHHVWMQLGTFLAWQNRVEIDGRDHAALAAFAAARVMDGDDSLDIERLLDVAALWLAEDPDGRGEAARRLICLVALEGPGRAHAMQARWGLPDRDPGNCGQDYAAEVAEVEARFDRARGGGAPKSVAIRADGHDRIFDPWPDGADVLVTYQRWRQGETWARGAAVLEDIAGTLVAGYTWPGSRFTLQMADCGREVPGFNADQKIMTICYQTAERYLDLGRRIASEEERE
jgi:hypothetical protein